MPNRALIPYNGLDTYIFLNYSHKNITEAMEIVENLQSPKWRTMADLPLKADGMKNLGGALKALVNIR